MQVSMDGTVKFAGYKEISNKEGKRFLVITVVDDQEQVFNVFCPGNYADMIKRLNFGEQIMFVFDVMDWSGKLQLRCKEVNVWGN